MTRRYVFVALSACGLVACNSLPSNPLSGLSGTAKNKFANAVSLPPGANSLLLLTSTASKTAGAAKSQAALTIPSSVTLQSATVVLKKIKLYLPADGVDDNEPDNDEGGTEIELTGPFLLDLVNEKVVNLGQSNIDEDADDDGIEDIDDDDDDGDGIPDVDDPDDDGDGVNDSEDFPSDDSKIIDALVLPPGTYRRIRFRVDKLDAEDAPDPANEMIGFSIKVAGLLGDVPFTYCASFVEDLEILSPTGTVVQNGSITTFVLTFDPSSWFDQLDLDTLTVSADGVIEICGNNNTNAADQVRQRIKQSARVGEDENGDGHDDNEDSNSTDAAGDSAA